MPGHDDRSQLGMNLSGALKQLDAGHPRHHYVCDQEIHRLCAQHLEGRLSVRHFDNVISFALQNA
jgi:hypothetical protein